MIENAPSYTFQYPEKNTEKKVMHVVVYKG